MAERRVRKPRVPRKRSSSHKNEQKLTAWSTTDDTSEDSCSSSSASEEFISFSPRRVKKKSKHATQAKPSAPLGKQEEEDLSMKYILQLIESGEIEASQDVINNIRGVNPEPSSSISAPMSQSRTTSVHRSHSMSSSSSQSASRREKKARKRTKRSDRRSDRDRGESETRRPHRSRRNRSSTRDRARRATKEAREQRRSSSSATAQDLRRARNPNQHRLRVALRSSDDGINPFEEDYTSLATLQPHYTAQVNNDQIASDEAYARELQVMESLGLGEAVGISSSDSSPQLPSPELLESSNEFELASDSDDDESSQVTRQEVVQFLNRLQLASSTFFKKCKCGLLVNICTKRF